MEEMKNDIFLSAWKRSAIFHGVLKDATLVGNDVTCISAIFMIR